MNSDQASSGGVLTSVLSFLLKLSWIGRVMTLGVAGAISFAAQDLIRNPDEFTNRVGQAQAYHRLGSAAPGEMPLSAEAEANLDRMIKQIADHMAYELKNSKWTAATGFVPWTVAQMTVATAGLVELNKPVIENFVLKTMDTACGCWHELGDKPEHIGVSGWVLYSLGQVNLSVPEPAVGFLLANQSEDGWWPIYPSLPNDRHASTYATAWALLGLEKYVARGKAGLQGDEKTIAAATAAIQRGVRWLKKTRVAGEAHWYDYPSYHTKIQAIGAAGHVLFVLHQFSREDELTQVNRLWMKTLDTRVLTAEESDSSDGYIQRKAGEMAIDGTRHLRLPWSLIATVKAFPSGTRWEQARALAWIERVLRRDLLTESVLSRTWVTSELLLALRELRGVALKKRKIS
ncbi:MAG: hypothetical protein CTY20_06615 [Hyphomicrobium sp.]|nr:MAG: hypothetical protein CTY20_06615 [Hyphomicrobium sp.]